MEAVASTMTTNLGEPLLEVAVAVEQVYLKEMVELVELLVQTVVKIIRVVVMETKMVLLQLVVTSLASPEMAEAQVVNL